MVGLPHKHVWLDSVLSRFHVAAIVEVLEPFGSKIFVCHEGVLRRGDTLRISKALRGPRFAFIVHFGEPAEQICIRRLCYDVILQLVIGINVLATCAAHPGPTQHHEEEDSHVDEDGPAYG